MADIDIGAAAIDRAEYAFYEGYTYIGFLNPANANGTIDTVEMWFVTGNDAENCKVGTLYGSGTTWTSRDSATIGDVTSGSKQTFTGLSIDVITNDIIGYYATAGQINLGGSSGAGLARVSGDKFGAGSTSYSALADKDMSLYGTGTGTIGVPIFIADYRRHRI